MCYQRKDLESVPGCSGEGSSGKDYCCDRPPNYLFYIGNNLGPDAYGLCEGDCDIDADCQGILICEQRREFTEVPGCEGSGRRGGDYCRYPDSQAPSTSPSTSSAPSVPVTSPQPSSSYRPTVESEYYQYTSAGTQCELNGKSNWQGPAPFVDKSNVALQFFAFGDTPYDNTCSTCNTCIGEDGSKEEDCTRYDCILKLKSVCWIC